MRHALTGLALFVLAAGGAQTARAGETIVYEDGVLNPEELTIDYWVRRLDEPGFDAKMCWMGYPALKNGHRPEARRILEKCAQHGMLGAMPAISQFEENGIDKPSNPRAAADWDRKLAATGSSLGAFNYGLDLLRGRGVRQDAIAGRAMIDRAAKGGDTDAQDLAAHGYDPEWVTPDADKPRYRVPGS